MPGLVLKLAPNERIYVNGAMVENGDRRSELCLPLRDTDILRERDIVEADVGTDALGAALLLAQMALMRRDGRDAIVARLNVQFRALLRDPVLRGNERVLAAASELAAGSVSGAHYLLLRAYRDRAAAAGARNDAAPWPPRQNICTSAAAAQR
ncbi:flagellar biosynthesis repressor FlbT [Pararhodobacter sp. SW119]|uniref:flagellar biosynthesis repressor FlbT n=1 Tax=Pararhodobacter sp. SW119 TaxID=2780075 RepID=UPI001AE01480|nr:flagellar biosynthesis repressor FlbT [Pararhodobacter sp. SW119]